MFNRTNKVANNPVMEQDIVISEDIWGKDLAYLKGHTMCKKPEVLHYDVIKIDMEDYLMCLTHDTLVLMSYSLICYVLSVVGSNDLFLVLYQLLVISAGYVFATKTTIEYLHRINPHNLYSDKIKPWPDTRDQNPKKNNQLQIEKVIYVVRHI